MKKMELYEKLRKTYLSAWGTRGKQLLESKIEAYIKKGLSREEAILRVAKDEGLISEEARKFTCPECAVLVFRSDKFCRNCGASLIEFSETVSEIPLPQERVPEELYDRKFSLTQRFYRLLTAPSEAMRDIALAPEYEGIFVIFAVRIILASVSIALALQKIRFSGPYAETISDMVAGVLPLAVFIAVILLVARWLIKSLMVRSACEDGNKWNFKAAASVTGYAYVADAILGILGICVSWFLLPTFNIDTENFAAATRSLNNYKAQLSWLVLVYALPLSFLGLLWKSYLGGLGAHFGTEEKCSLGKGVAVFFALGLVGLFLSFVISW